MILCDKCKSIIKDGHSDFVSLTEFNYCEKHRTELLKKIIRWNKNTGAEF